MTSLEGSHQTELYEHSWANGMRWMRSPSSKISVLGAGSSWRGSLSNSDIILATNKPTTRNWKRYHCRLPFTSVWHWNDSWQQQRKEQFSGFRLWQNLNRVTKTVNTLSQLIELDKQKREKARVMTHKHLIQAINTEFCRRILNVQRKTPNNACWAESGHFPLLLNIWKWAITFWTQKETKSRLNCYATLNREYQLAEYADTLH